jgi:hypothetical protein
MTGLLRVAIPSSFLAAHPMMPGWSELQSHPASTSSSKACPALGYSRSPSAWKRIAGRLIKERIAIAEALQARDAEAAELAVQRYVKRGKELVLKFGGPE